MIGIKFDATNVKFGYMDDDGNFHEINPHPIDISDAEIKDDSADIIADLIQDNIFYQGMIAAYEKMLGVDDPEDDE